MERRGSNASADSGNSSDIIEYDELETVQEKRPKQFRTTRQKVDRRPASTFHTKKFKDQTNAERICNIATCPDEMHYLKDESLDRGPVPVLPAIPENLYILSRALFPLALHWGFHQLYPRKSLYDDVELCLVVLASTQCTLSNVVANLRELICSAIDKGSSFEQTSRSRSSMPTRCTWPTSRHLLP